MALDLCQKLVSAQYLETNGQNFTKFKICIDTDNIYLEISTHRFLQIFTRVMALDIRQNYFVSGQYLENKLTKFHQTLNMHSY